MLRGNHSMIDNASYGCIFEVHPAEAHRADESVRWIAPPVQDQPNLNCANLAHRPPPAFQSLRARNFKSA